jgi:hypothetical protein
MRKNGVAGVIDKTPDLPGRLRGEEIEAWLALHPEVQVYAILDDESDMLAHQPHFKTSFFGGGLTESILIECSDIYKEHPGENTEFLS